jgi:carbamoyltransferase
MSVRILGISAYYHDSAAALLDDGQIVGAAQEERFTRIKGDSAFPHQAIGWCLEAAGLEIKDIDHIVFYEQPLLKFERLLVSYLTTAPRGLQSALAALPDWLTRKLWLEREIAKELGIRQRVWFVDHHLSHAASAFYPSPFDEAAILTIDGVGEWSTATWGLGRGSEISLHEELRFPNSLGLLYSAFTYYCGFKINSGEYKLMGLAPYGRPIFADQILKNVVKMTNDGSMILNQKYFNYVTGLTTTSAAFHELFEAPPRQPETQLTQRDMDLAASIQSVINEALLRMGRHVFAKTGLKYLTLAGGVALNCVATGKLASDGPFEYLWTQPAAGDAGGALGAALAFWHRNLCQPRVTSSPKSSSSSSAAECSSVSGSSKNIKTKAEELEPVAQGIQRKPVIVFNDQMRGAFLGPDIPSTSASDDALLTRLNAKWHSLDDASLLRRIATEIANGKIVAVARGPMEFGPRALGARSILGDARREEMQTRMNLKIKFRESFRPFAPMILAEDAAEYFDLTQESPYMLLVYPVTPAKRTKSESADNSGLFGIDLLKVSRSEIPAVTHVDFSARVQTIDPERNPFIHGVLSQFKSLTGCSVIVNTSFNVRGEPIVNTAEDAYRCFMATEIDCLVVGNRFLDRNEQPNPPLDDAARERWLKRFELD